MYMNREAIKMKNKKRSLWLKYTRTHDGLDYTRFTQCRNDLRQLTRTLRKQYEQKLSDDIKGNPKPFWRYVSMRLNTKSRVDDLKTADGSMATVDGDKARVLNEYFSSVFTVEDILHIPVPAVAHTGPVLDDVDISEELVRRKMAQLKPFSSAGPDGVHPRILRETTRSLAPYLAGLFRKSVDTGSLPREWRMGDIVPIFKKGAKQDPGNYRPISLTSVPCKLLEAIIRDQLMTHLLDANLLSDSQHGFRPKRSCATQLLQTIEEWSKMIEDGGQIDALYMDFSKAFDSVPHKRLLRKVRAHGIGGKLIRWIEAFLTDRSQRVVISGSRSDWTPVSSGVPQGSVLGPLLFVLYVNDLPSTVDSPAMIFADDTKVFRSTRLVQEHRQLQEDLDAMVNWSDQWQMPFNQKKCKLLRIGRTTEHYKYTMGGQELMLTAVERDLGVQIDSELKFRKQASAAVAKASQIMAVIRRSFQNIDKFTLPLLYKTLVRPHLEYCNIIWGPFNRADQKLVERVQRRATKLVREIRGLTYQERLGELKLPSLYYRRRRGDMITVYQILHGGVDLVPERFFEFATARDTRGHAWKLVKPQAATRVRRQAFSIRVINDWNALPATVVASSSITQFKSRIDTHWADIQCDIPAQD